MAQDGSMRDNPADVELRDSEPELHLRPSITTADRRAPSLLLLGGAVVLVLALVGVYLYLRAPSDRPAPAEAARVAPSPAKPAAEPGEQIVLPPLDQSDPIVRELVGRLSSHPTVAAWMTTDGLILNFAAVTLAMSNGESPTLELKAVGPIPKFSPRTSRNDLFIAPSSYQRYDRFAEAVSALDARGTARLYATLKPRIRDAHGRMAPATAEFDPVLERAIVEMLRVPVVQGEIELVPHGIGYAFMDPKLEGLSAAQKHLLRMGPKNVQAIQLKLREIADHLAIPASRLP
jgi:hypothetical protein